MGRKGVRGEVLLPRLLTALLDEVEGVDWRREGAVRRSSRSAASLGRFCTGGSAVEAASIGRNAPMRPS